MLNWNKNRTTTYMLPFVTDSYDKTIQAYLGINELKNVDFSIYVTGNSFIIEQLKQQDNFRGITYINNKPLCMMFIPVKYHDDDYMKFVVGNYGEIKNKRILLEYWAKHDKNCYNKLCTNFYNKAYLKKVLVEELKTNRNNFKEDTDKYTLEDILASLNEVDNILKLEDELIINK